MKVCTDCGDEVEANAMAEHMKDMHGVAYYGVCDGCHLAVMSDDADTFERVTGAHAKAHKACPDCAPERPCERAQALEGR